MLRKDGFIWDVRGRSPETGTTKETGFCGRVYKSTERNTRDEFTVEESSLKRLVT